MLQPYIERATALSDYKINSIHKPFCGSQYIKIDSYNMEIL